MSSKIFYKGSGKEFFLNIGTGEKKMNKYLADINICIFDAKNKIYKININLTDNNNNIYKTGQYLFSKRKNEAICVDNGIIKFNFNKQKSKLVCQYSLNDNGPIYGICYLKMLKYDEKSLVDTD